jgi:hypothetical protein
MFPTATLSSGRRDVITGLVGTRNLQLGLGTLGCCIRYGEQLLGYMPSASKFHTYPKALSGHT